MKFGDMVLPDATPAELAAALEPLALHLHAAFEAHPDTRSESRTSCVAASYLAALFLRRRGIKCELASVAFVLRAARGGRQTLLKATGLETLQRPDGRGWRGHLVAIAAGHLVDLTMYQFQHEECRRLPGMLAWPIVAGLKPVLGLTPLARLTGSDAPGHEFAAAWLPTPKNTGWQIWLEKYGRQRAVGEVVDEIERRAGITPAHTFCDARPSSPAQAAK